MLCINHRAHIRILVISGTYPKFFCFLYNRLYQLIRNALLYTYYRQSHASLPCTSKRGVDNSGSRSFDRGILQYKGMVFCLTQSLHSLSVGGRLAVNRQSYLGRAHKGNSLDIRMGQENLRFMAGTGYNINDAAGKSRFLIQLRNFLRRHRGKAGSL